ncbi:MAG: hypothetical protein WD533_04075 [Dehalococcoidia bacterium]
MAQESLSTDVQWWEMPEMPKRPQYLQLLLTLREQQPSDAGRMAELALLAR